VKKGISQNILLGGLTGLVFVQSQTPVCKTPMH